MTGLPVIDIAPLRAMDDPEALTRTAAEIDAAARQYGFFYAEGHGIADALFDRLETASRVFFALPEGDKAAIAMARGGIAWRGWFPLGGELTSGLPDQKEGLYLGEELGPDDARVRAGLPLHGANLWPAGQPELREAVDAYLAASVVAAEALMRGMALALGLPADHFASGITRRPTLLFRIFRYPPPDQAGGGGDRFGVGEHSDYGLLTLLGQDRHGGLEVRAETGEWIAVPPRGRALVINVGDMFERLTRGRFCSAPHRVINASGVERYSYPLFYDPDFAASVEPLPVVAGVGDRPRWDGVDLHEIGGTYGDYLMGKVGKVFPDLAGQVLDD